MVRKTTKTAKRTTTATDSEIAQELPIRDPDLKYTGYEPAFSQQPTPEARTLEITKALGWYGRYCDRKIAKEQLSLYIERTDTSLAKQVRKVDDIQINMSYCWLARMNLRGLALEKSEEQALAGEIQRLVNTVVEVQKQPQDADKKPKVNVQEIMREKAKTAGGLLEGAFDDFIKSGAKSNEAPNVVGILTENSVLPQHTSFLTDVWKNRLAEYQEVIAGTDKQLVEAYSHYSKVQLKSTIRYIEAILTGFQSYISVKKANRNPPKRRQVSPEKQASKIKYLKKFDELNLTSVAPSKLIGASEVWAYDTAKRKLHYYVADQHVGSLGVKGTTILGFDQAKSGIKTVRKPDEVIKKIMAAGKPAARKLFLEIKAVQAIPNGRTNPDLIFLKAY